MHLMPSLAAVLLMALTGFASAGEPIVDANPPLFVLPAGDWSPPALLARPTAVPGMCVVSGHSEVVTNYGSVVKVTRSRMLSMTRPFPHRPSQTERIPFPADQDGFFQAQIPFAWKPDLLSGRAMVRLPLSQEQPVSENNNCVVCQAGPGQEVKTWGACAKERSLWPEAASGMCEVHGLAVRVRDRHWRSDPLPLQSIELRAEAFPSLHVTTDDQGKFDAAVSPEWARELASGRIELRAGEQHSRLWQSNTCLTCPGSTPEAWGACRVNGAALPRSQVAVPQPEIRHSQCALAASLTEIRWISDDVLKGTDSPVTLTNNFTGEVLSTRPDEGGYFHFHLTDDWTAAVVAGVVVQRDGSSNEARPLTKRNSCLTCHASTPRKIGSCLIDSVSPGAITPETS